MAGMKRRDARALDHKTLEEIRIRAVERVQAGESPETVIQALGFTRSCIYTWLARYRNGGWGALKARALKGRPMKIQAAQMRWLYRTVTGKSPLQFRFEFALWTREMIRVLLREQLDLKLSVASVGRLLRQLGLSCQRPLVSGRRAGSESGLCGGCDEEFPTIRRSGRAVGAVIYLATKRGADRPPRGHDVGREGKTPMVRRTGQAAFGQHALRQSARAARCASCWRRGESTGRCLSEFLRRA